MTPEIKALWQVPAAQASGSALFTFDSTKLTCRAPSLDLSAVIKNAWDAANSSPDESEAFHKTLESGLPGIEKELFERSEETAEQTFQNLGLFTSPRAAPKLAEFFSSHGPPPEME